MSGPTIRPFVLDVAPAEIDDLHRRLEHTRWPEPAPVDGWDHGVPLAYLRELAEYWRTTFDWAAAQDRLNRWPQFTTEIDGARIHFAHLRSPEPHARPLMVVHGWPGSIVEFDRLADLLVDPAAHGLDPAQAFHLVLPSIPGFPLSGPTDQPGWEFRRVARAFAELMRRLGYDAYGTQGGDWGYAIARDVGRIDPEHVVGVHLNLIGNYVTAAPSQVDLDAATEDERETLLASWERTRRWQETEGGYALLQATRPQTLAYALTDSPVGQLAWIVEKLFQWSAAEERPEESLDRDQMLTNVTLYWLYRTAASSARHYYEREHAGYADGGANEPSTTPTAVAVFPHENFLPVRHLAERTNDIRRWTHLPRGGHFAAMEQPDDLAADIRQFFADLD